MHVVNNVTHLSVFSATHDTSWLTQPPSEPGGAISPGLKITHVIPKASNLCRISLWIFYIAKNDPFIANLWWFTRKIQGCPTANCEKSSQGTNLTMDVSIMNDLDHQKSGSKNGSSDIPTTLIATEIPWLYYPMCNGDRTWWAPASWELSM